MNVDALFNAIHANDIHKVDELTATIPPDQFDTDTNDGDKTALMLACEVADTDIIQLLLERGASPTYDLKWSTNTVLKSLMIGIHDDMEIFQLIVDAIGPWIKGELTNTGDQYADYGIEDEEEIPTPLELAQQAGKENYVAALKQLAESC